MSREEILQKIKDAGIVGAGGAGFPSYVKLNCKADVVIANGAECEPLLRTDRLIMENFAPQVIAGMKASMEAAGAARGVIALKKHYKRAIEALKSAIGHNIELLLMESYYPAGDEQQIVYEATGKVVPTGGLPLDVGAVVQNVSTLADIANALNGQSVTDKYVTVNGEVERPAVYRVPIGTPVSVLIRVAGAPDLSGCSVIIGGPLMGRITTNPDEPVTKTTGGILVLPKDHILIQKKSGSEQTDLKLAKSVCCQCNFCTQLCPRNALGLRVEPHKVMRAFALNAPDFGDANGIFSCCDCGICTLFACNFSLAPSRMMQRAKQQLIAQGLKPIKKVAFPVSSNLNDIKVPTKRLLARLDIARYDRDLPLAAEWNQNTVHLPLKMHIGAPAKPVVATGDRITRGQLIAAAPEGIGANIHASIAGRVQVFDSEIVIEDK